MITLTWLQGWPFVAGNTYIFVFLAAVRKQIPDWFSQCLDVKVEQCKGRILGNASWGWCTKDGEIKGILRISGKIYGWRRKSVY